MGTKVPTCLPAWRLRPNAGAAVLAVAILAAAPALAHAFPERLETPLPLGWYLAGAGAAVALSFLGAAGAMRAGHTPPRRWPAFGPDPLTLTQLQRGAGGVGLALLALLLALGVAGPQQDWQRNALPVAVWVHFWVLLLLTAALAANLYAAFNPFAALARMLGIGAQAGRPLPRAWPAAVLLVVFGLLELVWPNNTDPRALALLIIVYAALTLAGMHRYGRAEWLKRGEVFSVVFAQAGRLAPLGLDAEGRRLELRPWGAALTRGPAPEAGTAAVILILLTLVIFDGFAETMAWNRISGAAMRMAYGWGLVEALGYTWTAAAIKGLFLALALALVALQYRVTTDAVARIEGRPRGETARAYVLSLLPVALGYHLAHYFSYLLVEGQLIWPILSDPLGRGWDLFGTAGHSVDIATVNMNLIWAVALLGVVGGHVLGVLTAHRIALARSPTPARAARAHAPLVLLMVAVTLISLWTLSQPIVHQ